MKTKLIKKNLLAKTLYPYLNIIFLSFFISSELLANNDLKRLPIHKFKYGNNILNTYIAKSDIEKMQGLSGIKEKQFPTGYAMLFEYNHANYKRFWMLDTYFNLDIIFLDKSFKILHIAKNMQAHPGRDHNKTNDIQMTDSILSYHVLEIRSDDPIAKVLKIGESFTKENDLSK